MTDKNTHDSGDRPSVSTDGGTAAQAAQAHQNTNYLDEEVNLLNPSTPFMRDHLRLIWTGFIAWAIIVFVPVTLTAVVPSVMTSPIPVIGFPLHYFLVAIGAPAGALILSFWYARRRDKLDEKYGITHTDASETTEGTTGEERTATDGGVSK
ncbi:DUF4212 domain-containing protein [Haloarcula amylovorans]|uniref:DUF4212 domain-containing protein n=1 Tax=Haloarcula amylovorans TaxID=2562280 RepID=UPI001075F70A|nr:DUF4212 domain-containing protein [Halomicroarcula amylolytica]